MDRLFLDANVLFSAAYSPTNGILKLWKLSKVQLLSSRYALEEARINLASESQRERLRILSAQVALFDATPAELPNQTSLPGKDAPIVLAAMQAKATHLLTGDVRHFGQYFDKSIGGVLILPPAEYLKRRHAAT